MNSRILPRQFSWVKTMKTSILPVELMNIKCFARGGSIANNDKQLNIYVQIKFLKIDWIFQKAFKIWIYNSESLVKAQHIATPS